MYIYIYIFFAVPIYTYTYTCVYIHIGTEALQSALRHCNTHINTKTWLVIDPPSCFCLLNMIINIIISMGITVSILNITNFASCLLPNAHCQ